ncbi:hypothetical protein NDU88_003925 [Pleurodeles waltl]|uniref:Secreted protein n=1 Tax=Pleurodeles waltl TaxID=8319 RepID=A0AAV7QDA2_PLEWA|nr:hypothetical protein NDU88_003925 [Pleurodeles waltl]
MWHRSPSRREVLVRGLCVGLTALPFVHFHQSRLQLQHLRQRSAPALQRLRQRTTIAKLHRPHPGWAKDVT